MWLKRNHQKHTQALQRNYLENNLREKLKSVQDELTNVEPELTTQDKEKHAQELAQKELEEKQAQEKKSQITEAESSTTTNLLSGEIPKSRVEESHQLKCVTKKIIDTDED